MRITDLIINKLTKELYTGLSWADHPYNYWNDYRTYPIEVHVISGNHETMDLSSS